MGIVRRGRRVALVLWLVLSACAEDAAGGAAGAGASSDASLYPQVESIVLRTCAIERCHAGSIYGGGLVFTPERSVYDTLVDVVACQYDGMDLVEPGSPETSWLWIKLTAPFRPPEDPLATLIYFDPPEGWDRSLRGCPDETDEGVPLFGSRMPLTAPNQLPDAELSVIREWIAQGAPR